MQFRSGLSVGGVQCAECTRLLPHAPPFASFLPPPPPGFLLFFSSTAASCALWGWPGHSMRKALPPDAHLCLPSG